VEKKRQILDRVTAAEGLERYLQAKYVGQKRFSLEGGDSFIACMDELIHQAGAKGVQEIVIGMAHRGRLNVLVNTLGKMPKDLLNFLLKSLDLSLGNNTIPGGRYHNFKDFMSFPDFGMAKYRFQVQPPQAHPAFSKGKSHIDVVLEKDVLLHFPYQKFDHAPLRKVSDHNDCKSTNIEAYLHQP
jgi:hypothetical protein